jgi:hypothetical protein
MKLRILGLFCISLLLAPTSSAQPLPMEKKCPHEKGWKPTNEQWKKILSDHRQWLDKWKPGVRPPTDAEGRAILCNADLRGMEPLSNLDLRRAILNDIDLSDAKLDKANLRYAELNRANLQRTHLFNADLIIAQLSNANLADAKLQNTTLRDANLNSSNLTDTDLTNAVLDGADLSNAKLIRTKLVSASLILADLSNANLSASIIENARLIGVNFTNAVYAPASAPPNGYVAGLTGLSTVTFPTGEETGLVQLRDLLQKAGLRDLEREATFAIESGKTKQLFDKKNPGARIEATFRYIAFDLTTDYGLRFGRALMLIAALWAILIPLYGWSIWRAPKRPTASGIYRIWPKERLEVRDGKPALDSPAEAERLHRPGPAAFGWSAYFSLLSTFQIGFREFSVGTWLTRTQPRNFALEATGWVRTVAGIQSLLSVYLLAMWLLTYFGRPFQ